MLRTTVHATLIAALLATSIACRGGDPTTILDVPGRADATPSVAASGTFVVVAWGASGDGGTDVYTATSEDGGRTFAPPVLVSASGPRPWLGGEFPPRIVISREDGRDVSVVYTARDEATHIMLARSSDGGRTFGPPVPLEGSGAAGTRGWPALAADPSGAVHAVWLDHRGMATTGATPAQHKHEGTVDGSVMAQRSSLLYASTGTGPLEREVTRGVCYCCKTSLVTGANGWIYAAWRHVYPGNLRDIAMSVSRDGGRSFSPPVRVSEDGWEITGCPDDGPSAAVDAAGAVHVAWPTVLTGDMPQGALFIASGTGDTFALRVRIPTAGSLKPSHPQLIATPSGRLVVAWDEMLDGKGRAFLREVVRGADGETAFGPIVGLNTGDESGMYPALAATGDQVVAVWSTGGTESRIRVRIVPLP